MADRYWVGGTGTWNTISTTNWSETSGGSSGASVPTAADSVFFDQAATYTVTMTGALLCLDFTVSAGTVTFATGTTPTLAISGSWSIIAATVWNSTGLITLNADSDTRTISTNGVTINAPITIVGNGSAIFNLGSALTLGSTQTFTLDSTQTGSFNLNGFNITTGIFSSNNSNTRTINFGSNNIILSHTTAATTVLNMSTTTGFTFTGTGGFTSGMSVTRTFTCGNTPEISGSLSFNGTTSYLQYDSNLTPMTFGTGDFTFEAWINMNSTSGEQAIWSETVVPGYYFFGTSGSEVMMKYENTTVVLSSGAGITTGVWTHVAAVRTSGVVTFYVNGESKGSSSFAFNLPANHGRVGAGGASSVDNPPTRNFFNGYISNLRLVKGLSVYTGSFTPSPSPLTATQTASTNISAITGTQTSLLLNTPNNALYVVDSSSYAYTPSVNTAVTSNASTPITVFPAGGTPPNLAITSGASIPTISSGSTFNVLDFTGSTCTPAAATIYLNSDLTLASGGTYTSLSFVLNNTSTVTPNSKTIAALTLQGTQTIAGTINCTILTINDTTFDFNSGTITPSTSVVITGGAVFTYSGTATLGSVSTFTHTLGTVNLNKAYTIPAAGTYTLTAGTLSLGANLTTGIFSSSNTNTRAIAFDTYTILLNATATTVLSMATLTGFTPSGTGGFSIGDMTTPRTITCGSTAGGSTATAPNLRFTTGGSITNSGTITSGSWFNKLDYAASLSSGSWPATTVNVSSITLSASMNTTNNITVNLVGSGTITCNGKSTGTMTLLAGSPTFADTCICISFVINGPTFDFTTGTINPTTSFVLTSGEFIYNGGTLGAVPTFTHTAGTVTFNSNYSLTVTGTYTLTAGIVILADGVTLTTGIFSSSNTNNRTIEFGDTSAGDINLTHTTAATTVLSMSNTTGFVATGPGGFTVADMANTRTLTCGTIATVSGSILFNGTDEYLSITSATPLTFGTGNFTIETWINMNSISGIQSLWSETTPSIIFALSGTNVYLQNDASATVSSSGANIQTGVWTHVACVRISGVVTFYINGIAKGGGSYTANFNGNTQYRIGLGRSSSGTFFDGYISNFRVVKGLGVYTGNFTPSTSPLTATQSAGTNISAITGTQTALLLNTPNNASFLQDYSTYNYTVTNNNSATSNALTPITVFPAAGTPPNLTFTTGASIATITTASTFNKLDFGTTAFAIAATTVNVTSVTLSSGGTYTALGLNLRNSGTLTYNGKTSAVVTLINGSPVFADTITCTTFTVNGPTFDFTSGTLTPTTSFVVTSGGFIYNGGTLSAVPTFTHTAGNVTFNYNYALAATGTYTLTAGTLTLDGGVTLTTGIFSSSNTSTRSIGFGASIATAPGSAVFDGNTTRLTVEFLPATTSAFDFGTDDFTMEAWIYMTSYTTSSGTIVCSHVSNAYLDWIFYVFPNTGQLTWIEEVDNTYRGFGDPLPLNAWTHVAVSKISGTMTAYVNGVPQSGSFVSPYTISSRNIAVGGDTTGNPSNTFTGKISNVRIVKGVGVYTGTFTVPVAPLSATQSSSTNISAVTGTQTSLLLNTSYNSNFLTDSSTYNFAINNVDNVISSFYNPFLSFIVLAHTTAATTVLNMATVTNFTYTGTGGFVVADMANTRTLTCGTTGGTITNAPNLTFTTGASIATITTASWFKNLDFGTTSFAIAATTLNITNIILSSGGTYTSLGLNLRGSSTLTYNGKTTATVTLLDGSPTFADTIACTTFTVNGPTFNFTSGTLNPTTSFVVTSGGFSLNGGTLGVVPTFTQTAGNVTFNQNYSLTVTGTYTLTAGSLTLANGLILNTGIFSSTGAGIRSIGFGASITTNSGSVAFNGTSQYLTLPSNAALNVGSGDFTVECWIYLNAAPTTGETQEIFNSGDFHFNFRGSANLAITNDTTVLSNISNTIAISSWTHVAAVRESGTMTIYLNGVANTPATGQTYSFVQGTGQIGSQNGASGPFLNGYISNLRVVKGVAVYTGNFTVPTSPLTVTQSAGTNKSAITGTQTSLLLNTVNSTNFLTDSSTYNLTVTNNGAATSSFYNPFYAFINLTHTTAATTVLNMAALGGFSYTGTGGFTVADMANTRTFSVGNTSGGSPTAAPNLTFTTGASVATLTTNSWFNNLNYGTTTFVHAASTLNIAGTIILGGGTYPLTLNMIGTGTINNNAKSITALTIGSATYAGTTTLSAALTMTGVFTLTQGTILCPYNITSGSFASAGALSKTMTGTNITYTITGSGATAFSNTGTGLTMTGFIISMTNAAAKTFAGGGGTYPVLNQGGAGALTISGSNTFDTISASVQPTTFTFTISTTQTVNNFDVDGIAGSLVTINSSTAGTAATLSKASGTVYGAYLSIRDSTATGGATWYAGPTSTNTSNNTGWIFDRLPIITLGSLTMDATDGGLTISDAPMIFE